MRTAENSGPGAARNAALRAAAGQMVTYLDHDDEYFPNYFDAVMRHQDKGDVLVFGYEIVDEDADRGAAGKQLGPATRTRDLLRGQRGGSAGGCAPAKSAGKGRRLQ